MDGNETARSRKIPTIPIYLKCTGCEGRLDIVKTFGANDTWMLLVQPCKNCSIKTHDRESWLEALELEKLKERYESLEKENYNLKEENKRLKNKVERIENVLLDNEALDPDEVEDAKLRNKVKDYDF